MRGRPDIVALPKVAEPQQIARLDQAVARFEREYGIAEGSTALLPNIEFARGLVQTAAIAGSSRRIAACLLASEDLAADLGAERARTAWNWLIAASAFWWNAWRPASLPSIAPTPERCRGRRARYALGAAAGLCRKKPGGSAHAAIVNGLLDPGVEDLRRARGIVAAFEAARAKGEARAVSDGSLVELPTYLRPDA